GTPPAKRPPETRRPFWSGRLDGLLVLAAGRQAENVGGLLLQLRRRVRIERLHVAADLVLLQHQGAVLAPTRPIDGRGLAVTAGLGLLHDHPGLAILVGVVGAGEAVLAVVDQFANELHLAILAEQLPAARGV